MPSMSLRAGPLGSHALDIRALLSSSIIGRYGIRRKLNVLHFGGFQLALSKRRRYSGAFFASKKFWRRLKSLGKAGSVRKKPTEDDMTDTDLNALSIRELKQLQKDVEKAIASYEERKKAEARAELEAKAKEMGYTLSELMVLEVKKPRAPVLAKYRHPENPALTWSGRGRKPLWFTEALAAGKSPEDLAA